MTLTPPPQNVPPPPNGGNRPPEKPVSLPKDTRKVQRHAWTWRDRFWAMAIRVTRMQYAWVVGTIAIAALTTLMFLVQRPMPMATYLALTPDKLTGDPDTDKALEGLPSAIATSVEQMVRALDRVFVEIPQQEQPQDGHFGSVLKVAGAKRQATAYQNLPVDFFINEHLPPLDPKEQADAKLQLSATAGPAPATTKPIEVRTKLTQPTGKGQTWALTVLLGEARCEQDVPVLNAGDGKTKLDMATIANAVAACIVMHHIEQQLGSIRKSSKNSWAFWRRLTTGQRAKKAAEYFDAIYGSLDEFSDPQRQRAFLEGIEHFHTAMGQWDKESAEAKVSLKKAVDKLHEAIGHDDSHPYASRLRLGEYMFVLAASMMRYGPPQRLGQGSWEAASTWDFDNHVDRAFYSYPYECALWARAMAVQSSKSADRAPAAWQDVIHRKHGKTVCRSRRAAVPWFGGAETSKSVAMKKLAEGRLPAAHAAAGGAKLAMEVRADLYKTAHEIIRERLNDTHWGANHLNEDDDVVRKAAVLVETGVDAWIVRELAAQYFEVVSLVKRPLSFATTDIQPVTELSDALNSKFSAVIPTSKELTAARKNLDDSIKSCTESSKHTQSANLTDECKKLRTNIGEFLKQTMIAADALALSTLTEAIQVLEKIRADRCPAGSPLQECPRAREETSTLLKTSVVDGGADATSDASSVHENNDEDAVEPIAPTPNDANINALLRHANEVLAYARIFWIMESCGMPRDPKGINLDDIVAKSLDEIQRSPVGPDIGAHVGKCALMHAVSNTPIGKTLNKEYRLSHILESWVWQPLSPNLAFEEEMALNSKLKATTQSGLHVAQAMFSYPGALDVAEHVDRVEWKRDQKSMDEIYQSAYASTWDPHEAKEKVWAALFDGSGKENLKSVNTALAVVGLERLRTRRRSTTNAPSESSYTPPSVSWCREVRSLLACNPTIPLPVYTPKECRDIGEQTCPTEVERNRYQALPMPSTKDQKAIIDEFARETRKAQQTIQGVLEQNASESIQAFISKAYGIKDPVVRSALLRLLARVHPHPALLGENEDIAKYASPTVDTLIAELVASKSPYLPLLRQNNLATILASSLDLVTNDGVVRHTESAREALSKASLTACWPQDTNLAENERLASEHRWVRRFFTHVALNLPWYLREQPSDRAAMSRLDLVDAYRDWCAWGTEGKQWPIVNDETILGLAWVWQEDKVGKTNDGLVGGDELLSYLIARMQWSQGDASAILDNTAGLGSPEGKLITARAASATDGYSGLALESALKAEKHLMQNSGSLLDAGLWEVVADARLRFSTRPTDQQGWGEFRDAAKYYKKALGNDKTRGDLRRRYLAAKLEIQGASEVVEELPLLSGCWKDNFLYGVAQRMRGKPLHPYMVAALNETKYSVDDLPRKTQTGDPECDAPVYIGKMVKMYGPGLLRELR